jgi:hypothetical protein
LSSFLDQLPALLRQLADPVTPHTSTELWCRIVSDDWDRCVPVLIHALQTGENDVRRLVLAIVCEQATRVPAAPLQPFLEELKCLLSDQDRLVRMAAVHTVRDLAQHGQDLGMALPSISQSLRTIIGRDELPLAREALLTLLEVDQNSVTEIASLLRERHR